MRLVVVGPGIGLNTVAKGCGRRKKGFKKGRFID